MSMPRSQTVTCPKCGNQQDFVVWESLNATLNPAEKQQLLQGTLTRFTCQKCKSSLDVVYPLLYHDMEKQLMVWLWPGEGNPALGSAPLEEHMSQYQLRLVRTKNDLIEKILIFENNLDDRIVELFKWWLRTQGADPANPLNGELLFARFETRANGDFISFEHLKGGVAMNVAFPKTGYEKLVALMVSRLPSLASHAGKWIRVDQASMAQGSG